MWRALAVSGAALSLLVGGCVIFTGGTGGYSPAPLDLGATCTTSSVCASAACCYELDGGTSATCAASCGSASEQACSSDDECGAGGTCHSQSCTGTLGGVSGTATVHTCGVIPTCTAQ